MTETIDHEARSKADKALTKIEGHEDRCEERWQEARKIFAEFATEVKALAAAQNQAKGGRLVNALWMAFAAMIGSGIVVTFFGFLLTARHG